tara:strand:+ start:620 stop:871 length:252 start_codon:yes stop_codon:yes gene_type:complete
MKKLLVDNVVDPVIASVIVFHHAIHVMCKKETWKIKTREGALFLGVLLWLFASSVVVGGVFYLKSNFEISEELKEAIHIYENH